MNHPMLCAGGLAALLVASQSPDELERFAAAVAVAQELPVTSAPMVVVPPPATPVVDIAICLDTSGSMDGLIESAKQKLWGIVNEFIYAEPMPTLRVALLTYGNDGHDSENGWVQVETGLTEDLDLVSMLLFRQTTNGGTELVGRAVSHATGNLDWSASPGALKLIVVAGNESADQDQVVRYTDAAKAAITNDILVNAIFCGPLTHADAAGWQSVARLADGQFAAIDHDQGTVVIETPFDVKLSELSAELNGTYIAFGAQGAWFGANQIAQDDNAAGLNGEAAASRAICKANGLYNCASWDLIDALAAQQIVLAELEVKDLPEAMQVMTLEQRQAHVDTMAAQRGRVQNEVNGVAAKREAFITEELQRRPLDDGQAFDAAFRDALRQQAVAKGYRFPKRAAAPAGAATDATQADADAAAGSAAAPGAAPQAPASQGVAPVAPLPVTPAPQSAQSLLNGVYGPSSTSVQPLIPTFLSRTPSLQPVLQGSSGLQWIPLLQPIPKDLVLLGC